METNDTVTTEYKPRDYSLERWIVRLLLLLFLLPFVANAQETTTLANNEGAGLLLKTATPGTYAIVPAVKSEVRIAVTGPIVRTIVTQTFHNTTGRCVEGPPARSSIRLPRETIFIIDSSGSMEGASMQQAKAALLLALGDLKPGDKFNIIDFDSMARPLFSDSKFAGPSSLASAKSFVEKIDADGGTEMLKALQLAMPEHPTTPSGTVRQVIFMTDGQVGNEQELSPSSIGMRFIK